MKRLVLLNSPVLTSYGKFEFRPITVAAARQLIHRAERVESAIGHAATAEIMSEILNYEVQPNRIEFFQNIDDEVLIFRLKKRIGEGQILGRAEIKEIGYEIGILKKLEEEKDDE